MNEILGSEPKAIIELFFRAPKDDKLNEEEKSDEDMPTMESQDTDP